MARILRRLRRRPPFALVLVAVAGAIGGGFLLVGSGSGNAGGGSSAPPKLIGSGPARACVTAHAAASHTSTTTIHLQVSASAPVSATGRATVGRATVTVRLSQRVVQHATVARPLLVRRSVVAAHRACARGESEQAARGAALTAAFHAAQSAARLEALQRATRDLQLLEARVRPQTLASAQRTVNARARAAATAVQPTLARQAFAQARAKARVQSLIK
jgi:hypothetical protein